MGEVFTFKKKSQAYRDEMISMLEKTLEGVKSGDIVGFVFVGRKRTTELNRDAFEYIVANALDIGLIGEIMVLNQRLASMYDQLTDTEEIPTDESPHS